MQKGDNLLNFEWDEEKNQLNLKKHGIDFETAMLVFNDLQRIEIYDVEHSINEDRYNTIGMVHDVLFVVYTERKENIRLISARTATKTERSISLFAASSICLICSSVGFWFLSKVTVRIIINTPFCFSGKKP